MNQNVRVVSSLCGSATSVVGSVNMEDITVPTLMVVGTKDGFNNYTIAQKSFARIPEARQKRWSSSKARTTACMLMNEGETVSFAESESFQGRAVECDDLEWASLDPACGE